MLFEHSNTFLAGLTYLLFILPNASSGIIMGKYRPSRTIPPLLVLFGTGAISLFVFLHYGLTTGCIAAIILAGFGAGVTVSTSLKLLMQDDRFGSFECSINDGEATGRINTFQPTAEELTTLFQQGAS